MRLALRPQHRSLHVCKFAGVAADMLRRSGLCKALLWYVDDFNASIGPEADEARARAIVAKIESLGFFINWPKTDLSMPTRATSLGFILDTVDMSYGIPERRLLKLETLANTVLRADAGVRAVTIAQLTGQIWSMQPALGLICRLRSRVDWDVN